MKIKRKFKVVWKQLFEEITVAEYIAWWVVRILLLISVLTADTSSRMLLDFINMLAAYALPFFRLLAPEKSIVRRIDFRCQHLINFMEFLGTFFGHCLNVYESIPKYDRILHAISGPVAVIGGYYLYKAFESKGGKHKYRIEPATATYSSVSFSFVIIVGWEITEFLGDYFTGSTCQGYWYAPAENDIWFRIFGSGYNGGKVNFPYGTQ